MAIGKFWGANLAIHPHEALMQQGLSFTATHRNAALADDAVQQYMFEVVGPSIHANMDVFVGGDAWADLSQVTSYTVGAGSSLTVFNRNTEYTDVTTFTAKMWHTTSIQAGSLGIMEGIIPGGTKQSAVGGKGETDNLHLAPGLYQLEITNKSGAAMDVGFNITWEEAHQD